MREMLTHPIVGCSLGLAPPRDFLSRRPLQRSTGEYTVAETAIKSELGIKYDYKYPRDGPSLGERSPAPFGGCRASRRRLGAPYGQEGLRRPRRRERQRGGSVRKHWDIGLQRRRPHLL